MAGLDPAIHVSGQFKKDVDARVKAGHDEGGFVPDRIFAEVVIEMERE
jgi:hypothetical protein